MKQSEFAIKSGVSYSVYQKYEMGKSVPGGDAIAGFVRLGISADWLLTGKGPMLLSDIKTDELENDYEEFGIALAGALGLSKADLLQARADVSEAMKGKSPDDNNLEGTYPRFLAHLREAYLNVAKSLISKSPLWAVQPAQSVAPLGLDTPRFLLAIEAVEEGLEASNRTMTPAKKAELFMAVYDLMEEPTNTKARVLKLVKLAA